MSFDSLCNWFWRLTINWNQMSGQMSSAAGPLIQVVRTIDFGSCLLMGIGWTIDFGGGKLIGIVRTILFRGRPRRNQFLKKCHDLLPTKCILIDTPHWIDTVRNKALYSKQYLANDWMYRELPHPAIEAIIAWYCSVPTKSINVLYSSSCQFSNNRAL